MTNTTTSPLLPGRLGEPGRQLGDDPRADPRLIAAMAPLGLEVEQPSPVDATSPIDEIYAYCMEAETGFEQLGGILAAASPRIVGIERSVETITGVDGNEITLYVHRPADVAGPLPAVVHTHGGGMVILTAANAGYQRWRDELAATGIVLSGESGGGNLALATALSANRDGWIGEIAGVYAQCPYISGAYADPPPALTSLVENAGYLLSPDQLGAFARAYDPDGSHADDSLAWPLRAGRDDLAGLPPHVVSVNQLDPLRDEGLAFSGKLAAAGVSVVSRTVNGTCHAGDCLFRDALPEVYLATIRDIRGFAASL